ncbi:MAG: hypothetical protein JNK05_06065 [Myxococcales bacterium]|nr:hypothetical protein [Myxococcales bacterium]
MKTTNVSVSLGIFFALAACSPPVTNNQDSGGADAAGDASASGIGPMGGTVSEANGLSQIVVPAGALGAPVALTLELTSDETPLPGGAVRVGHQFKIGPMGTTFAQPVRWTLPYDPSDVATLNPGDFGVKVWVRTASGWMLTEPVEVTPSTVTIEVREATIAAAGVRTRVIPLACGVPGGPPCVDPMIVPPSTSCTGEFCVSVLVDPAMETRRIRNERFVTAKDGFAYWVSGESGGNAHRLNMTTGARTDSTAFASPLGTFDVLQMGQSIALDGQGGLWLSFFRHSFSPARPSARANRPAEFNSPSGGQFPNQAFPAVEVIATPSGSIHAYRRVLSISGEGGAQITNHVRMERWTFNSDLSVTGPVEISQGFGSSMVLRADPMQAGTIYAMGRIKPSPSHGVAIGTQTTGDGVHVLRINDAGTVLSTLTVPIQANGLSFNAGSSTDGLCVDGFLCATLQTFSLSVRGTELIAPTHPAGQAVMTVQTMDGASPMLTRTSVNLPTALPPVINVVHDSQGGLWLFTRNGAGQQVWHFNRTMNRVVPISLGARTPFGIASDGGDGIIAIVNTTATGGSPTGLVRVRRLMM